MALTRNQLQPDHGRGLEKHAPKVSSSPPCVLKVRVHTPALGQWERLQNSSHPRHLCPSTQHLSTWHAFGTCTYPCTFSLEGKAPFAPLPGSDARSQRRVNGPACCGRVPCRNGSGGSRPGDGVCVERESSHEWGIAVVQVTGDTEGSQPRRQLGV